MTKNPLFAVYMKKTKTYLDTSELYGYFVNAIRAVKHQDHHDMPENIRRLKKHTDRIYITSIITKAEIRRDLRLENKQFSDEKFNSIFEKIWERLIRLLDIQVIDAIHIDEKFDKMIDGKLFTCGTRDLIHLFIAKEIHAKMFTKDKNMRDAISKLNL